MKVFVTRAVPERGLQLLKEQAYEVVVGTRKGLLSKKEIMRKAAGADALLAQLEDEVDGELMDAIGPQLKVVANYAVGYDNIDLEAAKERSVAVTNTPGSLTESVAEHAAALILAAARRVPEADRFTRAGKYKGFEPDLLLGMELQGRMLGIVGHGRIGCRVAEILQKGFGMKVMYYDVKGEELHEVCGARKSSLEEILQEADVVSLHVPLLDSTRHLIGEKELKQMNETAFLVNTARGPVVDEQALVKALKEGWIRGAALDVFEEEPKLAPGLAKLENAVLTPHIASATVEARGKMAETAARNIIAALSGKEPPDAVA